MSLLDRLKKQTQGKPIRAAIYARFSSDNQRDESIDAQVHAIKEFAKSNDIVIVEQYIDRAKSATTDNRPDFQRMIKDSEKGDFQLVLVHKLDRFARNRKDSITYHAVLKRHRVSLLSVLEQFDEDKPESVLLQSVLEGLNEFYSRNLAREVKKGLDENARKGLHTGGKPALGYDIDPETRKYIINEHEAAAVRLMFQMVIDGHSYSAIIERLNSEGYKTKKKQAFGRNSIYDILHNPKYKGEYIFHRTSGPDPYTKKRNSHRENAPEDMIIIQNGVPAIISEEDFDKVQQLLEKRRYRSYHSKRNKEVYLLSGKMFCGVCGCRYVGNRKSSSGNRGPHITYRCNHRGRGTKTACKNREVNRDYVEGFVIKQLEKSIFNKNMIKIVQKNFREYVSQKNAERDSELRRLEERIRNCEKQQRNIADILAEGVSKSQQAVFLQKLDEIAEDKLKLQEKLEQVKRELDIDIPSQKELEKYFAKAREMFRKKTLSEMKQLIDLYVEKVLVYEDEIQVILNLVPFFYRHDFTQEVRCIRRNRLKPCKRSLA